jgi:hypothetical protein
MYVIFLSLYLQDKGIGFDNFKIPKKQNPERFKSGVLKNLL